MHKILMVCLGNICRSPLAAGILAHKMQMHGIPAVVHSAGTANYHVGDAADKRSIQTARKHNIDITQHTGRHFQTNDFDSYDTIYAMDRDNYRNILAKARNDKDKAKVKLLMNEVMPHENIEVPDPYYGGAEGFENVYRMINMASDEIINKIKKQKP
ncbi:MAG: low molecular weight phosphotyrosine protein phosphatase [Clostridia bacterium]|nr:low molecular weight phosphotyrosine protein phosphatase [Clostridia bacterium]